MTASCFSEFNLLSESEVLDLITASSKKSCPLNPIPTKPLNECVDALLPPITKIINLLLYCGYFPRTWKCALLWNALPFDIRSASTVSIFNANLKTHFSVMHF